MTIIVAVVSVEDDDDNTKNAGGDSEKIVNEVWNGRRPAFQLGAALIRQK